MMRGAEIFDVPGALTWNELTTRDIEGSRNFYGSVFGWTARDSSVSGLPYLIWEHAGQSIAGMQPMNGPDWPDDLPPHWMVYFAVADCDDSAALVQALGGRVVHPPTSFPMGRYAVVEDPEGGTFSILASAR
jgi:predicted enzyme related to lactoylglutathione lyase